MDSFTIAVPEAQLDDLRRRLARVRWPEPAPGEPWAHGMERDALRGYVDHWLHRYDWRRAEAEINGWPQFLVQTAGEQVHVVHARSDDPDATPLVLTHGWPGSIVEFLDC